MKKCEIPANTLPPCDLEWGHEDRMHANLGDGFYARDYDEEHAQRQTIRIEVANLKREVSRLCHALRMIASDPNFEGYRNEFGDNVDPREIARKALDED